MEQRGVGHTRPKDKRFTTYGGFHPKSDVDRLYVERSKGGRGLLSVKDVVEEEERQLKKYTERSLEDMMEIVRGRISFRGDRAEKISSMVRKDSLKDRRKR